MATRERIAILERLAITAETKRLSLRGGLLVGLSLAYFIVFPEDLSTIVGLIEQLSKIVKVIVELTTAVAPGLYGVAAAVVLAVSAQRVTERILAHRATSQQGGAAPGIAPGVRTQPADAGPPAPPS